MYVCMYIENKKKIIFKEFVSFCRFLLYANIYMIYYMYIYIYIYIHIYIYLYKELKVLYLNIEYL